MKKVINLILISVFALICSPSIFAKISSVDISLPDYFGINDEENDYQRTIAAIKKAIEADPENYENYGNLAFVYDYIGDYKNELEALKLEVKYMPDDLEDKDVIYGNLARAYLLTDQIDEAKPWLDKADKLNPDNMFNRWHSLTYYILKSKFKAAARELKKLDKLNTTDRDYYFEAYMFCLEKIKDPKTTVELLREAVKRNPRSPLSHRALGIAIRN